MAAATEAVGGHRRVHTRLIVVMVLTVALVTITAPYLAPAAQLLSVCFPTSCDEQAAWDLAPVMPGSALGDQHYEFSRAALIVSK